MTLRLIAIALVAASVSPAAAQRVNPALLQRKADSLQQEFVAGLDELATEYEEAGLLEEAKATMRRRLDITEDDAVAERLEALEERDFELRRKELSIDSSYGWTDTGVDVSEGEDVRIEASGEYRLMMNQTVGPDGLKTGEGLGDMPPGGLAAIVYPPRKGKKPSEPTEAVLVGNRLQFRPAKSGRLFLRVAVPEGATAKGELDVVVSGKITAARPR